MNIGNNGGNLSLLVTNMLMGASHRINARRATVDMINLLTGNVSFEKT